jgi:Secretion system C-terminal sorting domain
MKKSIFLQLFILLFSFNTRTFSQCTDSANPLWSPVPTNSLVDAFLIYNLTPTSNVIGTVSFIGGANTFSNNMNTIATFVKSATGTVTITFDRLISKPSIAQGTAQSFSISGVSNSEGQVITGFDANNIAVYPDFANKNGNTSIGGTNMNEIMSSGVSLVASADFTFPSPIIFLTISPKVSVTTGAVNITFRQICASESLPIEFTFFKAKTANKVVKLAWQTASEKNNKGFEIFRSVDANTWENIGGVKGQGTSNVIVDYNFEDKHPLSILTYYRLKQVDFDGKESYSNIESISPHKKEISFEVYPNPINNKEATITLDEDLLEGTLTVINSIGLVVKKEKINNKNPTLDLHDLTKGIYIFNIQKGSNFLSKKILITD